MHIIVDVQLDFAGVGFDFICVQFDNFAVGNAIRNLRKEKGISQDVLSGFAGIARTHLTMIENGTKQANFETLWKIALALDIRPSELVARIEEEIENHT